MSQKYNREEVAELRRLIAWYHHIADDYKVAGAQAMETKKKAELKRLEDEARDRADDYRAKLRAAGLP